MQIHYSQTPALQTLPKSERYKTYRDAHKALMASDTAYHHHWQIYSWGLISVVLAGALLNYLFPSASYSLEMFFMLVGFVSILFWQQNYMNTQIDRYLRKNPNGNAVA